jgi:hypothetical protein
MFENGAARGAASDGEQCVRHTHIHVLTVTPAAAARAEAALEAAHPARLRETGDGYALLTSAGQQPSEDYVYWQREGQAAMIRGPGLHRQAFRRALSAALGLRQWNWRDHPGLERVRAMANDLKPVMAGITAP